MDAADSVPQVPQPSATSLRLVSAYASALARPASWARALGGSPTADSVTELLAHLEDVGVGGDRNGVPGCDV